MNYWQDKKVLITGANGFIGANAVTFFANLGAKITAVTHKETNNIDQHSNIKIITANLLDPAEALAITQDQDIILNFAALDGSSSFKRNHSAEVFSANMRITINMLEALSKNPETIFLFTSSADLYPQTEELISEQTPININWDQKIDGYKLAKWVSELACREFINQYNLKTVIVRPSNIYGPKDQFTDDERLRFIPNLIKSNIQKKPITIWGSGNQKRAFLFIDDFLDACKELIEKESFNTPVNIAGKELISLLELADLVNEITGEDTHIILDKEKPEGAIKRDFDLKKLQEIIDEKPETPYKTGLKQTIDYFIAKHN